MGRVRSNMAISLDGYVAGPRQSVDDPLGVGGRDLHAWAFALAAFRQRFGMEGGEVNASTPIIERQFEGVGATVMGRNMFGGGPGPWGEPPWQGWWGDDPPFHMPVFVVTHHPRPPLELRGGTTFTFVTDGPLAALAAARAAAGPLDVHVAGGAATVRTLLAAGELDDLRLHLVPVLLGDGERLLDGVAASGVRLEQVEAIEAPGVTHLRYRRVP